MYANDKISSELLDIVMHGTRDESLVAIRSLGNLGSAFRPVVYDLFPMLANTDGEIADLISWAIHEIRPGWDINNHKTIQLMQSNNPRVRHRILACINNINKLQFITFYQVVHMIMDEDDHVANAAGLLLRGQCSPWTLGESKLHSFVRLLTRHRLATYWLTEPQVEDLPIKSMYVLNLANSISCSHDQLADYLINSPQLRRAATIAAGWIGLDKCPQFEDIMVNQLNDPDPVVRRLSVRAITTSFNYDYRFTKVFETVLLDQNKEVVHECLIALGRFPLDRLY